MIAPKQSPRGSPPCVDDDLPEATPSRPRADCSSTSPACASRRDARPTSWPRSARSTTARARRSVMQGSFDAFGAALVNGTAAHGEDFDDTFEGGPVHSGAVIVPAVVAACEREGLGGDRLLVGIVVRRRADVPPESRGADGDAQRRVSSDGRVRCACGSRGGRRGASPAGRTRSPRRSVSPAAWRPGIIEYLAEGTWTKRMHAGWAAQSGIRAALMARGGFIGPAHRARRTQRRVSRLRAVGEARFRAARRRPRPTLGDAVDRVQAIRVRHDDAAVHRLRDGCWPPTVCGPATWSDDRV